MKYTINISIHYVGDVPITDHQSEFSYILDNFKKYLTHKYQYRLDDSYNIRNSSIKFETQVIPNKSLYEEWLNEFDLTIEICTRPYFDNHNLNRFKFYLGKYAELLAIPEMNTSCLSPDNYTIIKLMLHNKNDEYAKKVQEIQDEYDRKLLQIKDEDVKTQEEINNKIKELLQLQYDAKLNKISRVKKAL